MNAHRVVLTVSLTAVGFKELNVLLLFLAKGNFKSGASLKGMLLRQPVT